MKTALRFLLAAVALSFSIQKANAQCEAKDILIFNFVPAANQSSGTCTATFDMSFTMQVNNGNKFIFFHAWTAAQYPDYFNCTGINGTSGNNGVTAAPTGTDLDNAFINVGINNNSNPPTILTVYPPDPSVPLNS